MNPMPNAPFIAPLPSPTRRQAVRMLPGVVAALSAMGVGMGMGVGTTLAQPASAPLPAAAATGGLRLGVLPNVSIRVLMANYLPVRQHLEAELSEAVQLVTASDLRAFHAATLRREYDVVVTAANLARIAQLDGQWQPLAVFEPGIPGVLVRSTTKPPGGLAALKGKRLALSNPQSLVAMRGFEWLAEQGLVRDTDYTTAVLRNDDSLYMALADGDIPYAIMSMGEFRAMPEKVRATLEIDREFARVMGFVVLAAPDAAPERVARLRQSWLKLMDSPYGKTYSDLSGVRTVRAIVPRELDAMDRYLRSTRAGLAA